MPAGIGEPGPSAWRRLDPLTRLVVSIGTVIAAIVLGGVVWPLVLLAVAVALPAARAGVLGEVTRLTLVVSLPLGISVALVNVLVTPGGADPITELGPFTITGEGVRVAAETVARIALMAGAVTLFYLTTRPSELVASLQAHGVPARATFVIHNAVAMIPRLADRAADVAEAQRARGLDSEGSLARRARGLGALAAPTVLGAIAEAETRTLALESRAFMRPGAHTRLWTPPDTSGQRLMRWSIAAVLALLVAARVIG